MDPAALRDEFGRRFGGDATVVRAPGRVNLIGEHTDYNEGFVLPAAIDAYVWAAVAPRPDRRVVVESANLSARAAVDLDAPDRPEPGHWSAYPLGVALMLEQAGARLRGADLFLLGEVPLGAGLSSSAALEVATAVALLRVADVTLDGLTIARLCQQAENEVVGARCGIMDQLTACRGRAGHALLLDCRSLAVRPVALPAGVRLVICNSSVKHALASGEYNRRRAECEEAVRHLAAALPGVQALRDVSEADLARHGGALPETIRRRVRHVVTENARTVEAAVALARGELPTLGALMAASHRSLRDDYEVSCAELDLLVELARDISGVYGARMTGGGFGGCTVNLVEAAAVDRFRTAIASGYAARTGRVPAIYVHDAVAGALAEGGRRGGGPADP